MSISQIMDIRGLYTNPSLVSAAPPGALKIARNVSLKRDSLAEPIRGTDRIYTEFPKANPRDKIESIFHFHESLWAIYGNNLAKIKADDNSELIAHIEGEKFSWENANESLYLSSSKNNYVLDKHNKIRTSGIIKPYIISHTLLESESKGAVPAKNIRAYRVVQGIKLDNRDIIGPPSPMLTIYNDSDKSKEVSLSFVAKPFEDGGFYEVYRTSDLLADDELENPEAYIPIDEMYLVKRVYYSPSFTRQTVDFTDLISKNDTGAALYTSPSQEGILEANDPPPLAFDICSHKNFMFYGNIKGSSFAVLKTKSIDLETIIDIYNECYISVDKNSKPTEHQISFTFVEGNPFATAQNFIHAINLHSNHFHAEILSLAQSETIEIYIYAVKQDLEFSVKFGNLPVNNSNSGAMLNGLAYSKSFEQEAVPKKNLIRVGSDEDQILRLSSLKESLFIFKTKGLYRLFGEDESSFSLDCLDSSLKLIAPKSLAIINNQAICLTDQGILAISENSISNISSKIENYLGKFKYDQEVLESCYAVAYQSENQYILFTSIETLIYNIATDSWSSWDHKASCALVHPIYDYLITSSPSMLCIEYERKSLTDDDYINYRSTVNLKNVDHKNNTAETSKGIAQLNDFIYGQTSRIYLRIIKIEPIGEIDRLYFQSDIPKENEIYHLHTAIKSCLEWVAFHAGFPSVLKQFKELSLIFDDEGVSDFDGSISFKTDLDRNYESESIAVKDLGLGWGENFWGDEWGGSSLKEYEENLFRILIPRDMQRGHRLSVKFEASVIRSKFAFAGISVNFRNISQKGIRYGSE